MITKFCAILIGLIYFSLQPAVIYATAIGATASENSSGEIRSDNSQNNSSSIFTTNDHLTGLIHITVNPSDIGTERPLYLVAQFNGKWYLYNSTGEWKIWNQQLQDLIPFTDRTLAQKETINLPLEYAKQEGQYAVFAGYLDNTNHIIFSKQPVSFTVFDETKAGLRHFSSSAMLEQFLKDGLKVQTNLNTAHNNLFF